MVTAVAIIETPIPGNNAATAAAPPERANFAVKLLIYKYFKSLLIVISLFTPALV